MTSAAPLFSVIVPYYNGARFIEGTLRRAIEQTCVDWEIVVCDDGSPDGAEGKKIVEQLRVESGRPIRFFRQENRGLGGARNAAIKESRGAWLALLDQDDVWYSEKLSRIKRAIQADPQAAVICHSEAVRRGGRLDGIMRYGPAADDMFHALLFDGNRLSTSSVALRRDVIEHAGAFSEEKARTHLVEDYDLWLRAARAGFKFLFIDEVLGECVLHDANYSATADEMMCRYTMNVMDDAARGLALGIGDAQRLRRQKGRVYLDAALLQLKSGSFSAFARSLANAARQNPMFLDSVGHKFASHFRKQRKGAR